MNRGTLVPAIMTALVGGGFVAILFAGQPVPIGGLFGTCPSASTDPGSVCYDQGAAQAKAARDAWTVEQLEVGHDCTPTGRPGQIPTSIVLETGGRIVRLPFAQAWTITHRAAPTRVYAQCFR